MTAPTRDIAARAAVYLALHERDILFRWTQRASRLLADVGQADTHLPALLDHMPAVFSQVRQRLLEEPPASRTPAIRTAPPQLHATTRYEQHVPLAVVVQEYQALRREVWITLQHWDAQPAVTVADLFVLEHRLNATLDVLIATALDTFVQLEAGSDSPPDDPGR